MKLINKTILGVASLAATFMFSSCTKSFDEKVEQNRDFSNSSLLQVYMGTVSAARNYVYVDSKPVNGAALTLGSVFPSTGYAFAVPGGYRAFMVRDTLTATTQTPLSFAENMDVGKNYTIFMYDTITSAQQKTVATNIVVPADTTARLRFANFVYNPTSITAFDIFSKKRNANIFTNVQVTDVTDFIPYASGITDTFYIRPTGTTTNLQNWRTTPAPAQWVDLTAVLTPTEKRSYTLVFRGGYRAYVSTNTTLRTLSVFVNR